MTNLQAAVGVAQLERLDQFVKQRRAAAQRYNERLRDVPGLTLPIERDGVRNVYWVYAMLVEPEYGAQRDALMAELAEHGVDSRPFFHPAHRQPVHAELLAAASCPVAERLGASGINLPNGNELTLEEVDSIAEIIRNASATASKAGG